MRSQRVNEKDIAALPVPASGSRCYYFWGRPCPTRKAPRGFGVRVTANGVRSFIIRYSIKNKQHTLVIGQHPDWTLAKAVGEAIELRQRIDRKDDPLVERRVQEAKLKETVQAVCEEYFKRGCDPDLRSKDEQQRTLARLFYPEFGECDISSIKRTDIVHLVDRIQDENGPVMANRTLAYVRKIMNWHAKRSDEFKSPIVPGMGRPTNKPREHILKNDEIRAVWKTAESGFGPFGAVVRFILLTCARRSEAAELPWEEIKGGSWTLPAARNKTKVALLRPLSKQALAVLPVKLGNFVFTTDGVAPISGFSKFKIEFDEACGVTDWTLHDLRRTARSLMRPAGVFDEDAEHCMGHLQPRMRRTYNVYDYEREKAAAYKKLAGLIERIVNSNVTQLEAAASFRVAKANT